MSAAQAETPIIRFDRGRAADLPAYAFGAFVVIPALFEVRGPAGRVGVPPKVFDLLVHLIAHRQRVVTHAELHAALWPDVAVTAGSLTYSVKVARALLGDSGRSQAVIRNVRGRGYRF